MESDINKQRLEALREENELLRQAAYAFGDLAERLSQELRTLRAQAESADRRKTYRASWPRNPSRSGRELAHR
jgi:alpha-ketoglutarate-dependent taurine dioxygenase